MASVTTEAAAVIVLDPWDKLLIIASAGLFLLFVLLCMMCVLSPFCWLYHYCPFQSSPPVKGQSQNVQRYGSTSSEGKNNRSDSIPLAPRMRYGSVKESSEFSDSSGHSIIEMKRSQWAESIMQRRSMSVPNGDAKDHKITLLKGTLEFTMKYDKTIQKLVLNIQKVSDMVLSDVTAIISPYVRVRFYRVPYQFFSLSKEHVINNLHIEIKTKMKKHAESPTFNEQFVVPIDKEDIKLYTVKLQLCDLDKFSRHIVLGETTITLKKMNLLDEERVIECSESLQPPFDEDIGDLSIGLNYLPTAEKLYLTIVKIRGLRPMNKQDNTTDAYVRVALMFDGRHLKKSKTLVKKGDLNPEFDETFAFDVPSTKLGSVYFRISVLHDGKTKEEHRLLGRVYVGPNLDSEAHAHWVEMIQTPRKQVTAWHKIQG